MPKYVVSKAAQFDLISIARHTTEKWGKDQAIRYVSTLRDCLALLAENLGLGRLSDSISAGLHRHECGRHVIFYRPRPYGIRISRVLHQNMLPFLERFQRGS